MSETTQRTPFAEWAILELMGHRRLAGFVSDVELFGGRMLRIDVPATETQPGATQFYSVASVYALTPTTEATARAVAAGARPAPVQRWELPAPQEPSRVFGDRGDDYDYEGKDDTDDEDAPAF